MGACKRSWNVLESCLCLKMFYSIFSVFKIVSKPTRELREFLNVCQVCVIISGSPNLPSCLNCYVKTQKVIPAWPKGRIKVFNVNFQTFDVKLSSLRKSPGRVRRTASILYVPLSNWPFLHFAPFKTFAMSTHFTLPVLQTRIIQGKLVFKSNS